MFCNSNVIRFLATTCFAVILAGCIPQPSAPPGGAPTSLTATAGNGVVTLSWVASSDATGYIVKRSTTSDGPYTQIATPAATAYADAAVVNGTTYFYVVSAYNNASETANSPQVSATPAVPTAPLAPTNLVATVGNAEASLAWNPSSGATGYRLKRATTSGGPYTVVATPSAASYIDTGLVNGTAYYYVVSAINAIGESPNSAQASVTPSPPPPTTFGVWTNVTPAGVDPNDSSCGNPGTSSVQIDPAHPSHVYAQFHCQGIWKSVDYGLSWTGPINTGTNGAIAAECEGAISISPTSTANSPTIFQACIRGNGTGFWKSVDGGVNWAQYVVGPTTRQDYLHPVVDPYDQNHLLMTGHEFDSLVESFDGGQTWSSVALNSQMLTTAFNSYIEFIDTGSAGSTRGTWLWAADGNGSTGTWRTANSGATWTKVDSNEFFSSAVQIHQPDKNGVVFIAGRQSALGDGVLRSTDYGLTWSRVGIATSESIVFGTSKNVYSMCNCSDGKLQIASLPGTGTWVAPGALAGPVTPQTAQVGVLNDGTNNILVAAGGTSGVWRYIEP